MGVWGIEQTTWVAKVTAFKTKAVCCVQCGTRYLYDMKRQGDARSTTMLDSRSEATKQKAEEEAQAEVERKLDREIDTVPCPNCGCYQPDMVALLRRQHLRWLRDLGWMLLLLAAAPFGADRAFDLPYRDLLCTSASLLAPLAVGLLFLRCFRQRRYDPNAGDPHKRIAQGQARAYSPEDADRIAHDRANERSADRRSRDAEPVCGAAMSLAVLGVLLLLGSSWLASRGALDILHGLDSRAWPKVTGQIERHDQMSVSGRSTVIIPGEVNYTYTVGERTYRGTKIWFGPLQDNEAVRRQYSDGAQVTVYYKPSDPTVAVLRRGLQAPHTYALAFAAGLGLLVSFGLLLCARRKYQEYRDLESQAACLKAKMWRGSSTSVTAPGATVSVLP
jgi:hypothetical protein